MRARSRKNPCARAGIEQRQPPTKLRAAAEIPAFGDGCIFAARDRAGENPRNGGLAQQHADVRVDGRNGQTIASASCISLDSLRGELRRLTGDRTKKLREIKKMEFEIKMTEEELREYLHFRETKQLEHGETEAAIQELNDL